MANGCKYRDSCSLRKDIQHLTFMDPGVSEFGYAFSRLDQDFCPNESPECPAFQRYEEQGIQSAALKKVIDSAVADFGKIKKRLEEGI